jgi:ankyrin repeat protein
MAAIEALEDGGSVEALVLLLRHGARADAWDAEKEATPLLMALFRRQREAVRLLLTCNADPNVVGAEGDSPLRWCVEQRDIETASLILRCGGWRTIDAARGPSGMTALGRAASQLDLSMVKLLLSAGADPRALDADDRTALQRLPPPSESTRGMVSQLQGLLAPR